AEVLHWAQKLWPANQFGKLTGRKGRCYLARPVRSVCVLLVSVVTGCAVSRSATAPVSGGALPSSVAPARDSLHIAVVYPAVTDVIQSHDSVFLFGAVRGGSGGPLRLGINGQSVPVLPNGAWIAWLPLPDDTVAHFVMAATGAGPDSSRYVYTARIAPQFRPPAGRPVWIDTTSFTGWDARTAGGGGDSPQRAGRARRDGTAAAALGLERATRPRYAARRAPRGRPRLRDRYRAASTPSDGGTLRGLVAGGGAVRGRADGVRHARADRRCRHGDGALAPRRECRGHDLPDGRRPGRRHRPHRYDR